MPDFRLKNIRRSVRTSSRFSNMDFIRNKINSRISRIEDRTQAMLMKNVEVEVKRSKVMRALLRPTIGVRGYDLAAEFGLVPLESQRAYYLILGHLIKTCTVKIDKVGRIKRVGGLPSLLVDIQTSFLNPKNYEKKFKGRPFAYPSVNKKRGTSYRIEWMEWLLNANRGTSFIHRTLSSVRQFGILYDFPSTWKRKSRSGRAVMIQNNRSGRKLMSSVYFPYEFPAVAKPIPGRRNFIDEVARDAKLINKLQSRFDTIIRNALKVG